jgi:protein phosphatase 4 regulatory subunit 3
MMGDPGILQEILSEKYFKVALSALEKLPEVQGQMLCSEYFDKVKFKEIVPIANEVILKKIHTSYRVNYLRETLFAKEEGPVIQGLAYVSFNCSMEILTYMLGSTRYLQSVMAAVRDGSDISK